MTLPALDFILTPAERSRAAIGAVYLERRRRAANRAERDRQARALDWALSFSAPCRVQTRNAPAQPAQRDVSVMSSRDDSTVGQECVG